MIAALLFLAAPQTLTILYSADRRSEVAPCHCDSNPLGGVDRQVATVAALRKAGPVLVLDGGDNFFASAEQADTKAAVPRAELIADALAKISPVALTPGALDFVSGGNALRTLGQRARATWLMSNVTAPAGVTSMFADHVVTTLDGQKILVLGFWSSKSFPPEVAKEGYALQDPVATAKRWVAGTDADLVIAIAQTDGQTEEALAGVDGISLVLSAHEGRLQFGARQAGAGQIVSAGNSGKYMVRLELRYQSKRAPLSAGMDVQKFFRELAQLRTRLAAATGAAHDDLQHQLDALQQSDTYAKASTLLFNLLPMDAAIAGDAELTERAKAIDPTGYELSTKLAK